MIRHVVMWTLFESADGHDRAANALRAKEKLLALKDKIPLVRAMEVGIDLLHSDRSYDLCLIASFDSLDDLAAYNDHPAHREVAALMGKIREKAVAVDFEV
ncbi:MAG TPA: Dabb family protein [bacterium]|nr:Dabb family protein [bacterium]